MKAIPPTQEPFLTSEKGASMQEAIRFANPVGALPTTRKDARALMELMLRRHQPHKNKLPTEGYIAPVPLTHGGFGVHRRVRPCHLDGVRGDAPLEITSNAGAHQALLNVLYRR